MLSLVPIAALLAGCQMFGPAGDAALSPTAYQSALSTPPEPVALADLAAPPSSLEQANDADASPVAPPLGPPGGAGQCVPGQVALPAGPPGPAALSGTASAAIWTEADLPGQWLASDGGATCGCHVVLGGPGSRGQTAPAAAEGCRTAALAQARYWRVETIGFGNPDLLLLAEDRRTVLARLDSFGSRHFRGSSGGAPLSLWR